MPFLWQGAELDGTEDVSMIQLIYGCLQYFGISYVAIAVL